MNFIKQYYLILIGVVVGAIAGYLYYYMIGCSSGSCSITSKPLNSTLYGSFMGGLLFSMFNKPKKKTNGQENNN